MEENVKFNLRKMGKAWFIDYLYEKYVNKSGRFALADSKGIKARTARLPKTLDEDLDYIAELNSNTDFDKLSSNSFGCSGEDLKEKLDCVIGTIFDEVFFN